MFSNEAKRYRCMDLCDWIFDDDEKEITGTITATSTELNGAGSGIIVNYDILTGKFQFLNKK